MKWFKHYNTASEGQSFELLISAKDYETAFIYWWLLEQVSKFEDTSNEENRGKITLNFSHFKRKLGLNRQRTVRVLSQIAKSFVLKVDVNLDETISVFVPNWLELQENRGGKKEAKPKQKMSKKTEESRGENQEERIEIENSVLKNEIHDLGKMWNLLAPKELPRIKATDSDRLIKIKKVFPKLKVDEWEQAIRRIEKSNFLRGIGEDSWLANFDWFIKNYTKVSDGNYDTRNTSNKKRFGFERDDAEVTSEFDAIARGDSK